MRHRQARLRSKYAGWYPKIQAGLWHQAPSLAKIVLYHRHRTPPFWSLEGRSLPNDHFEFRGGDPPREPEWKGASSRSEEGSPNLRQEVAYSKSESAEVRTG